MPESKRSSLIIDRTLAIIVLIVLIIAWFIGNSRVEAELMPFLKKTLPKASKIDLLSKGNFIGFKDNNKKQKLGYLSIGSYYGYGGDLKMAVAVSKKGEILGLTIVSHKETPSFLQRLLKSNFLKSLIGKSHLHAFELGEDLDGISGATYTARAIAISTRKATRKIAKEVLKLDTPSEPSISIVFGFMEILIIILFIVGYIGNRVRIKYRKHMRWIVMLTSLLTIGFYLNSPLTLVQINKMLLGFWPSWQTHIYFYFLLTGTLLSILLKNKNMYCERICPFGAAQECIGVIGGAKNRIKKNTRQKLKWIQRTLALAVIITALIYAHPGIVTYEVFGAFFHLIGPVYILVLLSAIMLMSLYIKRPWCSFLCPISAVLDYFQMCRNWIISVFKKHSKKKLE